MVDFIRILIGKHRFLERRAQEVMKRIWTSWCCLPGGDEGHLGDLGQRALGVKIGRF